MIDTFFRILASENSVQWVKHTISNMVAGSPARPLDPVTRSQVEETVEQETGRGKKRSKRERSPAYEPLNENDMETHFTIPRYEEPPLDENDILTHFTIPEFEEMELIIPENFQEKIRELDEPMGLQQSHEQDDEEILIYEDEAGGLIRHKHTARAATLMCLLTS